MKILHNTEQRCRGGFTLVEMMVVLFIVLGMLAMSVPFFTGFSSSTGLRTAERGVGTILRTARSYAISRNESYNVFFNTATTPNTYSIRRTAAPNVPIDKTYQLPSGVSFTPPVPATVTFTSNGGLAGASATTVTIISTKGVTKQITVETVTGAVTMP